MMTRDTFSTPKISLRLVWPNCRSSNSNLVLANPPCTIQKKKKKKLQLQHKIIWKKFFKWNHKVRTWVHFKLHSLYNVLGVHFYCDKCGLAMPHSPRCGSKYHELSFLRVQMRNPCQQQCFARWPPHVLNWFQGICTKVGNIYKAFFIRATCEEVGEHAVFKHPKHCLGRTGG